MSIPAARERLSQLANDLETVSPMPKYTARVIRKIIEEEMFRAVPVSRAPRKIKPLTPEQIAGIKEQHRLRPDMSQLELAKMFNSNPGRVSEALNGKV